MNAVSIAVPIPEATLYAGLVPQLMASEGEDAVLVRRIAAATPRRDTEAEAEVCRRFASRIRLFGLRHLRNEAAAADLAQDVLIITLEKLRSGAVRDAQRLAAFVLSTARQCVVDSRRNAARRQRILETFPVDLPALVDEGSEPLDTDRLGECLQSLPERERTVLLMTFYADDSAQKVGTALGLSAANVRVVRHRGIERLRDCMNLDVELP